MTTVYFIRHAESDINVRAGKIRPLTEKGMKDRALVTTFLQNKKIDVVFSSPYKRSFDTVAHFAEQNQLTINTVEDFRERKSDSNWLRDTDFFSFIQRQWQDFNYKLSDGENLHEVQRRNIAALQKVLLQNRDRNIVIGTHGTALSTIINYYDNTYGYDDFMNMINIMPWIVKITFDGDNCVDIEKIDLFSLIPKFIHVLGASGSGTTTLGKVITERFGHTHFDSDDYFWLPTDPPFTNSRERSERQKLLLNDMDKTDKCVITGSICGWGDVFIPRFDLVIFVATPTDIRIERLKNRELKRFGNRILPGGDMHKNNVEFIEWAGTYDTAGPEQRSRALHTQWLEKLPCPIIYIDGTKDALENSNTILLNKFTKGTAEC